MVKRVSTEEKLQKIVAFFQSSSEVYTLKELDKKIPKQCGISSMLVKDLLQNLHGDNRINIEKFGSSNLYWRFKYQDHHEVQCLNEKTQEKIDVLSSENQGLETKINEMKENREVTEERNELFKTFTMLSLRAGKIEKNMALFEKYSTDKFTALKNDIETTKSNINTLTDDVFTLQAYVCNKCNLDKTSFNKNFNIPDELDYVE